MLKPNFHKKSKLHTSGNDLRFIFILLSRYPTKKAYGVTTRYSAKALKDLNYQTKIVTPFSYKPENSEVDIEIIGNRVARFLLKWNFNTCVKFRFNSFLLIYTLLVRKKYNDVNNVLWCRDIMFTFILSFVSKNRFVCEIHRSPLKLQKILFRILLKRQNVIIAPISNFLDNGFIPHPSRFVYAPMSVNDSDLEFFNSYKMVREERIIYVGNSSSGGIDLNCNLLNEVAFRVFHDHPEWTIDIVGTSKEVFVKKIRRPLASNIRIIGVVDRENIPEYLAKSKVGLVIYPNLEWFHDSFPIKIVEYAAAGLGIVASDTVSHRRILNESLAVFFNVESVVSLSNQINRLIENSDQLEALSNNATAWVKQFTYRSRVENILNKLI